MRTSFRLVVLWLPFLTIVAIYLLSFSHTIFAIFPVFPETLFHSSLSDGTLFIHLDHYRTMSFDRSISSFQFSPINEPVGSILPVHFLPRFRQNIEPDVSQRLLTIPVFAILILTLIIPFALIARNRKSLAAQAATANDSQ